ncbi:MAG: hypothetical protein ACQEVA_17860 [Myxococcota bacterium]
MQAVICRFRDEDEFLSHRTLAERMGAENGFLLLGSYELDPGQTVDLKLLIRAARERTTIAAKVLQREPVASDDDGRMWRYLVEVEAQDTVWLEMLDEKLRMRMRVTPNAA